MDKKISRVIAQRLCDLRRARGRHINTVHVYEAEFKGAINILWSLELISSDEWKRLYDLASKFASAAIGISWPVIKNQYRQHPVSTSISEKVIQDEPEQVSASSALGPVSVRGVLVPKPASGVAKKPILLINLMFDEDGELLLDRTAFPRLGKHWAPRSVLVGYQKRKGHSVLRA